MKFNSALNNFSSGHWSPRMLSATNEEAYQRACSILKNKLALKQGGAYKRPGLVRRAASLGEPERTEIQTGNVQMIPYGTGYIVCTTLVPFDAGGGNWFTITSEDTVSPFGAIAYIETGAVNVAVADPSLIHWVTSQGNLYFVSPGIRPRVLSDYVSAVSGPGTMLRSFGDIEAGTPSLIDYRAVPYKGVNSLGKGTPQTMTASGTTGAITITASSRFFTTVSSSSPRYVGTFMKLTSAGTTGVVRITSVVSSTVANATVIKTLPGAIAYGVSSGTSWEQSAWSDTDGWPTSICLFQQRLFLGRGDRVWASRIGDLEDFMEIPLADDPDFTTYASDNSRPFTIVPALDARAGNVVSLAATKVLIIGFEGAEAIARGVQGALGPNDIQVESHSSFGAYPVQMVKTDEFITYVQRDGKSIRDLIFSYENEQYRSIDIAFMADDYFIGKTVKKLIPSMLNGTSVLFVLFTDGSVIACALDRERGIVAWSELEFTGTNVSVTDIACYPRRRSNYSDSVMFLIQRTINGSSVRYFEEMADIFDRTTYSNSDMYYYMDSTKIITSPGSTTINVDHLIGETVHVFGDGAYLGTKVVTGGGTIVLDAIYSKVVVGLLVSSRLVPAPLNVNTQSGYSTGMVKKITSLTIKFWNSITAKYGDPNRNEFYDILTRSNNVIASTNIPLFTGDQRVQFPPGFERTKQLEIKSDLPFPCNVLSIAVDGTVYD